MVVFSMDSKRIRRPSVRLWEVGDLSAAFACGISHSTHARLRQKKLKKNSSNVEELKNLQVSTTKQPEYTILDPDFSPVVLEYTQYNTENKDPNSVKSVSEFVNLEGISMSKSKLEFGTITRKPRIMNRRRRNPNSTYSLIGDLWSSKTGSVLSMKDEKGYRRNGCASEPGFNIHHIKGYKDHSEIETAEMGREACLNEIDEPNFSMLVPPKPKQVQTENASWYDDDTTLLQPTYRHKKEVSNDCNIDSVSEWLEEHGFGKFIKLFEMHEVDKETLPLLTFKDLKDMGIVAVGPRLKLFTAIQQLKGGS